MKLLLVAAVALAGCSTAASAVGSLIKPKPPEITVVTNVTVPAPAPVAVDKHDGPAKAMVAGALAGGVAAVMVRTTPASVASGVLVGAGVGYFVHAISD